MHGSQYLLSPRTCDGQRSQVRVGGELTARAQGMTGFVLCDPNGEHEMQSFRRWKFRSLPSTTTLLGKLVEHFAQVGIYTSQRKARGIGKRAKVYN